jgi:hypothetical protein
MLNFLKKKKHEEEVVKEVADNISKSQNDESENEIVAAIAIALNLYVQNVHDYENMILTIQKVVRPYSPWSSKIYGLSQFPRR